MDGDAIRSILSATSAVQIAEIKEASIRNESVPLVLRPAGGGAFQLESVKALLDEWRTAPERRKGTATVHTLRSFNELVNYHTGAMTPHEAPVAASPVVFADLSNIASPNVQAVIDYHENNGQPRFLQHRIQYAWPVTPEWKAWQAQNGKVMTQAEWCTFIEEHIAELAAPSDEERSSLEALFATTIATPAELVQMSRSMQVLVEARVKEARVLQSGEAEVVYEETHRDGITGAKLTVPGLFMVNVPLFMDAPPDRLPARLRYRKADGRLVWFFQLYRPDVVVRQRLLADLNEIGKETDCMIIEGQPER